MLGEARKIEKIFPLEGIMGERVGLRSFVNSDISCQYISWLSDPDVLRFSNQRFRIHNKESCENYFNSFTDSNNCFLLIKNLEDLQPIGTMTIYIALEHLTADLGIMIGERKVWGKGLGQEAWSLVVEWLLNEVGIRKVTGGCVKSNIGMIRLMERSGMQHEATFYKQEVIDGFIEDLVFYAKFGY